MFLFTILGNFKSDKEPLAVGYSKCTLLLLLSDELTIVMFIAKEYQCVCHTFCQDVGLNSWKVVFVFIPPEIDLEVSLHAQISDFCPL